MEVFKKTPESRKLITVHLRRLEPSPIYKGNTSKILKFIMLIESMGENVPESWQAKTNDIPR